jgi:hypothetical protein
MLPDDATATKMKVAENRKWLVLVEELEEKFVKAEAAMNKAKNQRTKKLALTAWTEARLNLDKHYEAKPDDLVHKPVDVTAAVKAKLAEEELKATDEENRKATEDSESQSGEPPPASGEVVWLTVKRG